MAKNSGERAGTDNISDNKDLAPDDAAVKWQTREGEPRGPYGQDYATQMTDKGSGRGKFGAGD